MLEVVICEDDLETKKLMEETIKSYLEFEGLDGSVVLSTDDPYAVLELAKAQQKTRLYFLDIDLGKKISGMELARELRHYDPTGFITFCTSHSHLAYMTFTYRISALDFIQKGDRNDMRKRIREGIQVAYTRYGYKPKSSQRFKVSISGSHQYVDYADIIYCETMTEERKIIITTPKRSITYVGTLKEIVDLDERFILCHRSYVVNRDHIDYVDRKNKLVYMKNGDTCEVSRNGLKLFK